MAKMELDSRRQHLVQRVHAVSIVKSVVEDGELRSFERIGEDLLPIIQHLYRWWRASTGGTVQYSTVVY